MGKDKKRKKHHSSSSSSRSRSRSEKKSKKHKQDHPENKSKRPESNEEIQKKINDMYEKIKETIPAEPELPPPKNADPKFKKKEPPTFEKINTAAPKMIEIVVNDRLGKKVRVKCW